MRLRVEASAEELRRLRRIALYAAGGWKDLATLVVAALAERTDGTAGAVLTSWTTISRVCRAAAGNGGYQRALRRVVVALETDDGELLTEWPEIRDAVDARRVRQMPLFWDDGGTNARYDA